MKRPIGGIEAGDVLKRITSQDFLQLLEAEIENDQETFSKRVKDLVFLQPTNDFGASGPNRIDPKDLRRAVTECRLQLTDTRQWISESKMQAREFRETMKDEWFNTGSIGKGIVWQEFFIIESNLDHYDKSLRDIARSLEIIEASIK